ncbi:aminopeptidase P N-terminal domain-containing protein [Arthrobacter sp. HLT1-20]
MTEHIATPTPSPAARRLEEARPPKLANVPVFTEYMSHGWGTPDRTPPVVAGAAAAAGRHRSRLSEQFPGQALVIGAGTAPRRANDTFYDFRPDSDFYWLSGAAIEGAVLVMAPSGASHDATLFIPAPFYPGDPQFFTNAAHGEMWVGSAPRLLRLGRRPDPLREAPVRARRRDRCGHAGRHGHPWRWNPHHGAAQPPRHPGWQ